jgi:hypothetical protein
MLNGEIAGRIRSAQSLSLKYCWQAESAMIPASLACINGSATACNSQIVHLKCHGTDPQEGRNEHFLPCRLCEKLCYFAETNGGVGADARVLVHLHKGKGTNAAHENQKKQ